MRPGGSRLGLPPVAGFGIAGVEDGPVHLMDAVHSKRLLVRLGVVPVIEDPCAAAEGRGAALERRPGCTHARGQVEPVVEMGLELLSHADAQRQAPREPDVVLRVPSELDVRVADTRVSGALRKGAGPASDVGVEARKREGSARILDFVAAIAAALEQHTNSRRVTSARVVDVGRELEVIGDPATVNLRAAVREGTEYGDGRHVCQRRRIERLVTCLEAGFDKALAAERAAHGGAEQVFFRSPASTLAARG